MSTPETQQDGNNGNPPENDSPSAGTSNKKKKNNKSKQKKQNSGNGNSNNGNKFKGSKTDGPLKGKTLSDNTKLLVQWKDFKDAIVLQATVEDKQPVWGDAFKDLKRPDLQKSFKRMTSDAVGDGWGKVVESPVRDEHGNKKRNLKGEPIVSRVVQINNPLLHDEFERQCKSRNKFVDQKRNSHIEYKKIALALAITDGQITPTVESKLQLSDAYKAAIKKNDIIEVLCAIRDTCYNASSMGSEPTFETFKHLRVLLNFKQKPNGELGPFAEKLTSRYNNTVKRQGDCPFGTTLMEEIIKKKYPQYSIFDYVGVGCEITIGQKNGNTAKIPVTKMTQEEKEECDEDYNENAISRLLVLNNNREYVQTFLHNLYINNKTEYPNTSASTLLQITSIKQENNNQTIFGNVGFQNFHFKNLIMCCFFVLLALFMT